MMPSDAVDTRSARAPRAVEGGRMMPLSEHYPSSNVVASAYLVLLRDTEGLMEVLEAWER